jgi:hypothetical protein
MEYSFSRYLLAKQTVDDRSLNRHVLAALRSHLPPSPQRVIEIGAGIGNMLARLLSWEVIARAEYVHEDSMTENIRFAAHWIPEWALHAGMQADSPSGTEIRIADERRDVRVTLTDQDLLEFVRGGPAPADLLIANAFLDLLPLPETLPQILSLTKDLAWFTIVFDGVTSLAPTIEPGLDEKIIDLYHRSMDRRPTGGDSRAGRHLLDQLRTLGVRVLAAGASDWVVYANAGKYPADEAYFLESIIHFFEESLTGDPDLDPAMFQDWLATRNGQIKHGQLSYIAHQMDFLVQV